MHASAKSKFFRYWFQKIYGYDPIHAEIKHSRWTVAVWDRKEFESSVLPPIGPHDDKFIEALEKITNEYMLKPGASIRPKTKRLSYQFESKPFFSRLGSITHVMKSDKQRQLDVLNNILTYDGMAKSGKLGTGQATGAWTHIAMGTGTTPEQLTDHSLTTEVKRKAFTSGGSESVPSGTQTEKYAMPWYDTDFTVPITLYESGIFDGASAYPTNLMYCHVTFAGKTINSGDLMTSQINVTHQNGTVV